MVKLLSETAFNTRNETLSHFLFLCRKKYLFMLYIAEILLLCDNESMLLLFLFNQFGLRNKKSPTYYWVRDSSAINQILSI